MFQFLGKFRHIARIQQLIRGFKLTIFLAATLLE